MKQKMPPPHDGSIDKTLLLGYTEYTKGATGRRFSPDRLQRSNRCAGKLGGYFFFTYLII